MLFTFCVVLQWTEGRERNERDWRRLHIQKLHALCSSPDMIRMRQVWVRNNSVWWENPTERKKNTWKNLKVDDRIILECVMKR